MPFSCCGSPISAFPEQLAPLVPAMFDSIPGGLLVIDRGHQVLHANQFVVSWLRRP